MRQRLLAIAATLLLSACATQAPKVVEAPPRPQGFVMPEGYRWSHGHSPKAQAEMAQQFGTDTLAPNQYKWIDTLPAEGTPRILVDLKRQMTYAYKGDVLVGAASISSGKKGKETPLGFWTVLDKRKSHFSRKYDNAPMPYFQRIDRFGIGFHAGPNPGHPASHGCIRLPKAYALKLFGFTAIGTEVTIEG